VKRTPIKRKPKKRLTCPDCSGTEFRYYRHKLGHTRIECKGCGKIVKGKGRSKYGARKQLGADGRVYDSRSECSRADELRMMERGNEITGLTMQPKVVLDAAAGITYKPDFQYEQDGRTVWEDWKPRPLGRDETIILKLWRAHGPGLLILTWRKKGRTCIRKRVMANAEVTER